MIDNINELNWGYSEMAIAEYQEQSKIIDKYESSKTPLHHVNFLWEDERRIEIVFGVLNLEIL